ncbi:MAG: electron transfer flavoprotein subunit alpha/FixB family protein [Desulfobacterales bacterium]|nr:MAG: electron transfer flavoprotein subunit alpha/FixB family protein [Desulfobacterales bacterium]
MEQTIVVVAEHFEGRLQPVTYELLAWAAVLQRARPAAMKVVILGDAIEALATEIAQTGGVDVIGLQVADLPGYNGEIYRNLLPEVLADLRPAYVCIAHTSQGLDFAPALAVALNAACITGVEDIRDKDGRIGFVRPVYGGKIAAHVRPTAATSILTFQLGIFKSTPRANRLKGTVDIKFMAYRPQHSHSMGLKAAPADTAGITAADTIIAAGNGIGKKDNLALIYQLAALFPKAAVAGSRLVCDRGWLEYNRQVGVTGATVAPKLYLACGISGAVQHVAGMREAGFVVAINSDPAAPIHQIADICVVEDLTTFIPLLIEEYKKSRPNAPSG